jgi:hypothetical protein
MTHLIRFALAAGVLFGLSGVAAAQQPLSLEIREGRVTLHARNVPVRQILAEWARVGGTTIVNGERVAAPPVTLELNDVPERQALDILLRGVAGYVLGARPVSAPGASSIDRVLILATSSAPGPPPAPTFTNGPATRLPRPQFDPNDPEENPENVDGGPGPRGFVRPGVPRRLVTPLPQAINDEPSVSEPESDDSVPQEEPAGALPVSPSNPFGVPAGTSATPGVVTPVPQAPGVRRPRIEDPD